MGSLLKAQKQQTALTATPLFLRPVQSEDANFKPCTGLDSQLSIAG